MSLLAYFRTVSWEGSPSLLCLFATHVHNERYFPLRHGLDRTEQTHVYCYDQVGLCWLTGLHQ